MERFLLVLLFLNSAFAETNYSLNLGLRSKPVSSNIVGQAAYDGMIWGEKSEGHPLYGFYRLGARIGGSPTAAAFIQIAPIAPLIFEIQQGTTRRFFDQSIFDCDQNNCQGTVDRTDYTVKLGLAYEKFVFMGQANWRDIKTESATRPIALELETFAVNPGTHNYFEAMAMTGYKLTDNRIAGLLMYSAQISSGHQRFTAGYGIYRFKWEDYSILAGAGHYKSDYSRMTGPSVILSITREWGKSLGLF